MTDVDRYITEAAVDAMHKAMDGTDGLDWHYSCHHAEEKDCWKGDYVRDWIRIDLLPAALPGILAQHRRDVLREAAIRLEMISVEVPGADPTAEAAMLRYWADKVVADGR